MHAQGHTDTQLIKHCTAGERVLIVVLAEAPQSIMRHLRWIMQKDSLGQDVFLIGPPGPLRRNIAMMYLVRLHEPFKCTSSIAMKRLHNFQFIINA